MAPAAEHHRVVIIGAGIAGVGLGARLRQQGIDDFVICERNDEVGGTWLEHTYPGCSCDIPTYLYSYSFAPNPDWTRIFAGQREILAYVQQVADDFGVRPHVRLGCEMHSCSWDEDTRRWHVGTSRGRLSCDVLVTAVGAFSEPEFPDVPGWEAFEGEAFHSARWRHDLDLAGTRVAVIGTGAAAVQFVPEIQPRVARLDVYQRTPPWILPHPGRLTSERERRRYRRLPLLQRAQRVALFGALEAAGVAFRRRGARVLPRLERLGRDHLRAQVSDPDLRARLAPAYRLGCKRPMPSDAFYPALQQDNVELVTDPIAEIAPGGIVTAGGTLREADVIIAGTGYRTIRSQVYERIAGVGGRSLAAAWHDSPRAYLGSTVPGFPNMFMLLGPNSTPATSVVFVVESQMSYVLDALRVMDRRRLARIELRPERLRRFVAECDRRSAGSVWTDGGCNAYYTDERGRNVLLYPGFASELWRRTRRFDAGSYDLVAA